MTNSEKTITFKINEETYDRLTRIKNHLGCTYSEVIEKLVELELKNNYIKEIRDYVFITEKSEGYFRLLIKKDENILQYSSKEGYVANINKWDIPNKDRNMFNRFITDSNGMLLLQNIQVSMEFRDFIIFRE